MDNGDNNIRQKVARIIKSVRRKPCPRALYPLIGLEALVWFLVRVIPKPTRSAYPCQRIAAPLASGFIAYLISILASVLFFRQARQYLRQTRYLVVFICIACGTFALIWHIDNSAEKVYADFNPTDLNSPRRSWPSSGS